MSNVSKNTLPVATHGATGYQGKVKIAVFKGKRQIKQQTTKNSGTNKLFEFLCECLVANYNQQRGPTGIQLANESGTTITNPILISRATVGSANGTPQVTFSFVVPFSAITKNDVQKLAKLSLVSSLYNEAAEVYSALAEVVLEGDDQITMSKTQADYSLNIDWILSFTNVATS